MGRMLLHSLPSHSWRLGQGSLKSASRGLSDALAGVGYIQKLRPPQLAAITYWPKAAIPECLLSRRSGICARTEARTVAIAKAEPRLRLVVKFA